MGETRREGDKERGRHHRVTRVCGIIERQFTVFFSYDFYPFFSLRRFLWFSFSVWRSCRGSFPCRVFGFPACFRRRRLCWWCRCRVSFSVSFRPCLSCFLFRVWSFLFRPSFGGGGFGCCGCWRLLGLVPVVSLPCWSFPVL